MQGLTELGAFMHFALLFVPRESASHNNFGVLVYFYEVRPFPSGAVFRILFDGNFSDLSLFHKPGEVEIDN